MKISICITIIFTLILALLPQKKISLSPEEFGLGSIYGVVKNCYMNPVQGVKVGIEETEYVVYTDLNGKFSFINLTPGNYTLSFMADGYKKQMKSVEILKIRILR